MVSDTIRAGGGPILRLFEVTARSGYAAELLTKFATTSADVVRDEPGSRGYFFGREISVEAETVLFASVWRDLDAVKARFGDDWQASFLPDGYDALIETCSVRHVDLSDGWHVDAARSAFPQRLDLDDGVEMRGRASERVVRQDPAERPGSVES